MQPVTIASATSNVHNHHFFHGNLGCAATFGISVIEAMQNVIWRLFGKSLCINTIVQKSVAKWIDFLYGPFFKVIGFFYRIYTANRARVEALKANRKVSSFLKLLTVLVLVGWILTWFFASEESRNGLVDDVKQSIGFIDSESGQAESGEGQNQID